MGFGCHGASSSNSPVAVAAAPNDARSFEYDELVAATGNFAASNFLGQGGYGVVYRAILPNVQEVAVKRLINMTQPSQDSFWAEFNLLNSKKHPNIINLLGFHASNDKLMLVLELMPLRSLDKSLYGIQRQPLDWGVRFNIAEGIAKALQFLHAQDIIFRDLKPHNILLGEDYFPKLADFGLVKLGSTDESIPITSHPKGTAGYMDPWYNENKMCTPKVDVYAFGVLLIELMIGRKLVIADWDKSSLRKKRFGKLIDQRMEGAPRGGAKYILGLAKKCVSDPAKRPSITEVLSTLSRIHENRSAIQCLS